MLLKTGFLACLQMTLVPAPEVEGSICCSMVTGWRLGHQGARPLFPAFHAPVEWRCHNRLPQCGNSSPSKLLGNGPLPSDSEHLFCCWRKASGFHVMCISDAVPGILEHSLVFAKLTCRQGEKPFFPQRAFLWRVPGGTERAAPQEQWCRSSR